MAEVIFRENIFGRCSFSPESHISKFGFKKVEHLSHDLIDVFFGPESHICIMLISSNLNDPGMLLSEIPQVDSYALRDILFVLPIPRVGGRSIGAAISESLQVDFYVFQS